MQSVACKQSALTVKCNMSSAECYVKEVKFKVESVKCGVQNVKCRGWIPVIVPVLLLRAGVVYSKVSRDWRFHTPNTLLKREGLQLAKVSSREK